MKKTLLFIFICWGLSGVISYGQTGKEPDFRFVVISDTHISNDAYKDERLSAFMKLINTNYFQEVDFLVNTGDVCSSVYKTYDPVSPHGYNRLAKAVEIHNELSIPYYLVMGNHDYKIDSDRDSDLPFSQEEITRMEKIWSEITGFKPYYSFIHKGWKFIVLDSMHGRGQGRSFGVDQIEWLAEELDTHRPVIIFVHHPLKTDHFRIWAKPGQLITRDKEPAFFDLLNTHKDIIKGIFVGHGHLRRHDLLDETISVYETASFGEDKKYMNGYVIECDQADLSIRVQKIRLKVKRFLSVDQTSN